MDGNTSNGEGDDFDWDTEDELEIGNFPSSSFSSLVVTGGEAHIEGSKKPSLSGASSNSKLVHHFVGMGFPEETVAKVIEDNREGDTYSILETLLSYSASSSAESSNSKLIDHFVRMGFSEEMVSKAIQENGEDNMESILESLLTYSVLEKAPQEKQPIDSDHFSSDYEGSFLNDFSDSDIFSENEEITTPVSEQDNRLLFLVDMGYTVQEASIAIERCGPDSSIEELMDFISAAHMAKAADALLGEDEPRPKHLYGDCAKHKKRKLDYESWKRKKQRGHEKRVLDEDDETIHLPNPMIGFGVPSEMPVAIPRTLPEAVVGPPYFYYENVALTPKGVWTTISRFLYDVEPEFVDSKYFCAAARKRGYVHNLPIQNRFSLRPAPPRTIHEAFPLTRKWWPSWDTRTKLNCLQTCIGSAKLTERIRKALEDYDGEPPLRVQKYVLDECRKWNLVWVGRNKVAPLEPDEVEMLLGFPKNHTRGISRTDRYKSLGNSFQIDTVAYHLSVLKDMFPGGINMLSLFSGIGGAEVALHRLGIPMNNVVSVEILEVNRNIVQSWWDQTNQRGNLFHINDVQELDGDKLEVFMSMFGGFDLVIGGSPCNNLAGSNRHSRDGLEGKESALFYDYFRILDLVKCAMKN